MQYPIRLVRDDNDTILVDFPDFPEAHTYGDDREEARARAVDALTTIVEARVPRRRTTGNRSKSEHPLFCGHFCPITLRPLAQHFC